MNAYDFVHLAFLALGGRIRGKTRLQKTVYFLGVMSGELKNLGYRPHFFGPYSPDVADAVNQLRSLGFINQTVVSGPELARFDFRLSKDGKAIGLRKAQQYCELWGRIAAAAESLKKAGEQHYEKLSIAAKTYFMLGEKHGEAEIEELAKLADKFGWRVSRKHVIEAARFLESLGLVHLVTTS